MQRQMDGKVGIRRLLGTDAGGTGAEFDLNGTHERPSYNIKSPKMATSLCFLPDILHSARLPREKNA